MITVRTTKKEEIIVITDQVREEVKKSKVKTGLINIFCLHATAALMINENADPLLLEDILNSLRKIVPEHDNYHHDRIDNNAAAHLRAGLLHSSLTIQIQDGDILLGQWQGILLVELDGPRARQVETKIVKVE
ncbi:MAG: secondary thiamine-phosphate synthase enzyme YjbQ [Nanoarchaeota archaeon]